MLLGDRITLELVIEGGFVQEDRRVLSNFRKSLRGTTVAAVGEFEAGGKGEGDGLSAITMRDVTADQIGETSGAANSCATVRDRSVGTSMQELGRLKKREEKIRHTA